MCRDDINHGGTLVQFLVHAGQMQRLSITISYHAEDNITFLAVLVLVIHQNCIPFTYW